MNRFRQHTILTQVVNKIITFDLHRKSQITNGRIARRGETLILIFSMDRKLELHVQKKKKNEQTSRAHDVQNKQRFRFKRFITILYGAPRRKTAQSQVSRIVERSPFADRTTITIQFDRDESSVPTLSFFFFFRRRLARGD